MPVTCVGAAEPDEATIIEEACWLADTGRYADFTDIEHVLRCGYGMADARAILDRYPVRRMLNHRCADAREEPASCGGEPASVEIISGIAASPGRRGR